MTKKLLSSVGSVVFAFIATQHHNVHMLLVTLGVGTAGLAFVASPIVRYALYGLSLGALGFTLLQLQQHWHSLPPRVAGIGSALLTVGLLAWSISQYGL